MILCSWLQQSDSQVVNQQILLGLTHPQEYLEDVLYIFRCGLELHAASSKAPFTLLYSRDVQRNQGSSRCDDVLVACIPVATSCEGAYP